MVIVLHQVPQLGNCICIVFARLVLLVQFRLHVLWQLAWVYFHFITRMILNWWYRHRCASRGSVQLGFLPARWILSRWGVLVSEGWRELGLATFPECVARTFFSDHTQTGGPPRGPPGDGVCTGRCTVGTSWAPARGEQGGQAHTLEKIMVGMAHPGNFSRGLKTSWQ